MKNNQMGKEYFKNLKISKNQDPESKKGRNIRCFAKLRKPVKNKPVSRTINRLENKFYSHYTCFKKGY
tara:strand:- start:3047 stop:3250 length:204 start_codon:yes stop_codon:yes gene_type:complete